MLVLEDSLHPCSFAASLGMLPEQQGQQAQSRQSAATQACVLLVCCCRRAAVHGMRACCTRPAPCCASLLQEAHPCALHSFDQIAAQAAGKLVAVFLDYDGGWVGGWVLGRALRQSGPSCSMQSLAVAAWQRSNLVAELRSCDREPRL